MRMGFARAPMSRERRGKCVKSQLAQKAFSGLPCETDAWPAASFVGSIPLAASSSTSTAKRNDLPSKWMDRSTRRRGKQTARMIAERDPEYAKLYGL